MILQPEQHWECPSCDLQEVTHEAQPHTRFHACRGLAGLTAPMVPAGTRAEHRLNDRQDYVNGELVQRDGEGRVVMSLQTIRDNGEDCTVFAPTARGTARA